MVFTRKDGDFPWGHVGLAEGRRNGWYLPNSCPFFDPSFRKISATELPAAPDSGVSQ